MALKPSTATQVAQLAGVSKWTVIRAFDPDASVSEETRRKVHDAAKRLGYRPNLLARSLATRRTNQVAVLIDDFTNLHKLPVIEKLSLALQAEGKILIVININRRFQQIDALMHARQRQLDGVILFANSLQDEILEEAKAGKIHVPLVILGRESTVPSVPSVTTASKHSMMEIVEHLKERGYHRPAFMTGPAAHESLVSRSDYFAALWRDHGISDVPVLAAHSYDRANAEAVMRDYLRTTPHERRVDVLMCENDNLAMGAMNVVRNEFDLRVPEDLAIVGYDNIDMAASPAYGLTTYEQPLDTMIAAVLDILAGRRVQNSVEIPGRLISRTSA